MRGPLGLTVVALGVMACGRDGSSVAVDAPIDSVSDAAIDAIPDAGADAAADAMSWPQLVFDVTFDRAGDLALTASDLARSACTRYGFLRTGCEDLSDFIDCGGGPLAPWITSVILKAGAATLATVSPVDVWTGVSFSSASLAGHDDLMLVLEASDGQRAEIPIPAGVVQPQPAIVAASYDGGALHLEWSASPTAASSFVQILGGGVVGGYRCHVASPQHAIDLPWLDSYPGSSYSISTFAAAPPIPTSLGEAKVWIGGRVDAPIPDPR